MVTSKSRHFPGTAAGLIVLLAAAPAVAAPATAVAGEWGGTRVWWATQPAMLEGTSPVAMVELQTTTVAVCPPPLSRCEVATRRLLRGDARAGRTYHTLIVRHTDFAGSLRHPTCRLDDVEVAPDGQVLRQRGGPIGSSGKRYELPCEGHHVTVELQGAAATLRLGGAWPTSNSRTWALRRDDAFNAALQFAPPHENSSAETQVLRSLVPPRRGPSADDAAQARAAVKAVGTDPRLVSLEAAEQLTRLVPRVEPKSREALARRLVCDGCAVDARAEAGPLKSTFITTNTTTSGALPGAGDEVVLDYAVVRRSDGAALEPRPGDRLRSGVFSMSALAPLWRAHVAAMRVGEARQIWTDDATIDVALRAITPAGPPPPPPTPPAEAKTTWNLFPYQVLDEPAPPGDDRSERLSLRILGWSAHGERIADRLAQAPFGEEELPAMLAEAMAYVRPGRRVRFWFPRDPMDSFDRSWGGALAQGTGEPSGEGPFVYELWLE